MTKSFFRIGKIVREHGFAREGRSAKWKADLFTLGEAYLEGRTEIWISREKPGVTEETYEHVQLAGPLAPMGGRWGLAKGLLLEPILADAPKAMRGDFVCVPREWLPPLEEAEFYIEDIQGFAIIDETGKAWGKVTGFSDPVGASDGAVVIRAKGSRGDFEFPAVWIEEIRHDEQIIVVPEVSQWAELG